MSLAGLIDAAVERYEPEEREPVRGFRWAPPRKQTTAKVAAPKRSNRSPSPAAPHRRRLLAEDPSCRFCGTTLSASTATLDHLTPLSRGGSWDRANLALACGPCNTVKGNLTAEEFRAVWAAPPMPPAGLNMRAALRAPQPRREVRLCDFCSLPGALIPAIVEGRPGDRYHAGCIATARRSP